jgi:hypothetical protein
MARAIKKSRLLRCPEREFFDIAEKHRAFNQRESFERVGEPVIGLTTASAVPRSGSERLHLKFFID